MIVYDMYATELALGDTIVFPRRFKGKLSLGSLTIHELHPDKLVGPDLTGRKITVRNLDRIAKVVGLDEPKRPRRVQYR